MSITISPRPWTKQRVIRELWDLADGDVAPPARDSNSNLRYGANTLFGGWTEACHAAGLLTHLEGEQRRREMEAPRCANPDCNQTTTYGSAHCSHECRAITQRRLTKRRIVAEVRALATEAGVAPPSSEHPRLKNLAHTHFGGWGRLVEAAGLRAARASTACKVCGGELPQGRSSYCSPECQREGHRERVRQRDRRQRSTHTKRRVAKDPISRAEIIAAYGGICQLCGEPTNPDAHYLDRDAASLTTRELGQERTKANLIPAHRRCTISRAQRGRSREGQTHR